MPKDFEIFSDGESEYLSEDSQVKAEDSEDVLGDLAPLLLQDNVVFDTPDDVTLPAEFIPLSGQASLQIFVSEKLSLIRKLDHAVSVSVSDQLDQIDASTVNDDFEIFTTKTFRDMLLGPEPPTREAFLSLPSALDLSHEVRTTCLVNYVQTWTKGSQIIFRVYNGSALSAIMAAYGRLNDYSRFLSFKPGTAPAHVTKLLSKYCQKSNEDGWVLEHVGVAFIARRTGGLARLTGYMLSLEAVASYTLWSNWRSPNSSHEYHYLRQIYPWRVDNLPYEGLNSHGAMHEFVRSSALDEECLNGMPKDVTERNEYLKLWRRNRDKATIEAAERGEIPMSDVVYLDAKKRRDKFLSRQF